MVQIKKQQSENEIDHKIPKRALCRWKKHHIETGTERQSYNARYFDVYNFWLCCLFYLYDSRFVAFLLCTWLVLSLLRSVVASLCCFSICSCLFFSWYLFGFVASSICACLALLLSRSVPVSLCCFSISYVF